MSEYYQHLVYIQLILEIVLLVLLSLLWRRTRKQAAAEPHNVQTLMEMWPRFIKEAEELAENFQRNLHDKKALSADLILKLDSRLKEYQAILDDLDKKIAQSQARAPLHPAMTLYRESGKANPAAPETRALVLRLAQKGLSLEEIAVQTRLHQGEVELIIDLERQFDFGA